MSKSKDYESSKNIVCKTDDYVTGSTRNPGRLPCQTAVNTSITSPSQHQPPRLHYNISWLSPLIGFVGSTNICVGGDTSVGGFHLTETIIEDTSNRSDSENNKYCTYSYISRF